MRSVRRGQCTSSAEVTNVSSHGLWVLVNGRELFLSFELFPWFREAPIGKVLRVELQSPGHLYWPELDIDLAVESIHHPERFPLVSQVRPEHGAAAAGPPNGPPLTAGVRRMKKNMKLETYRGTP